MVTNLATQVAFTAEAIANRVSTCPNMVATLSSKINMKGLFSVWIRVFRTTCWDTIEEDRRSQELILLPAQAWTQWDLSHVILCLHLWERLAQDSRYLKSTWVVRETLAEHNTLATKIIWKTDRWWTAQVHLRVLEDKVSRWKALINLIKVKWLPCIRSSSRWLRRPRESKVLDKMFSRHFKAAANHNT